MDMNFKSPLSRQNMVLDMLEQDPYIYPIFYLLKPDYILGP